MSQRVSFAEKRHMKRYEYAGVSEAESNKDLELHTDCTFCVKIMLGAPIIAQGYR